MVAIIEEYSKVSGEVSKMENFFSEKYLNQIYQDRLSNSKAKGIDKVNSISFSNKADDQIKIIARKVKNASYLFSPYLENLKLKGRNKAPRVISIPTIRDRITLLALKEYLHNKFPEAVNRKLPNSYIKDIKEYLSTPEGTEYFIQLDIQAFYDNIDREILMEMLQEKVSDDTILNLISCAIETPTVPPNTSTNNYDSFVNKLGVPQGLAISNILAQIYLLNLDKIIDKRKYSYHRYVDDIIILNRKIITDYRYNNVVKELEKVKLKLNEGKTKKGYLKEGFIFLSYKISDKSISVAEKNVELFIRRIAAKFTWFKNGMQEPNKRPNWLKNDERFKEVFIEELNETITGIISEKKNYGWLFYFSEMNDETLLYRLDNIIAGFFSKITFFENRVPSNLKKISRAFKAIKYKTQRNYICNYDDYSSIRRKRNFLIFRGKIDPDIEYSDDRIEKLFERFRRKQIRNVEKDIGYSYM